MKKKEEKPKQRYFASYIYEEDDNGIPYELFAAETPIEKWQNNLRWTMAVSYDAAVNNIRAKLKYKLGYTWGEVQKIGIEFGPVKIEDFMKDSYTVKEEKKIEPTVNLWTSKKPMVNVVIDSCTVTKEETLFTVSIPVMDTDLKKFIEHYLYHFDNYCLVDDKNTPLCAFTFRENAEALGKIVDRKVSRLYVDKSMWKG